MSASEAVAGGMTIACGGGVSGAAKGSISWVTANIPVRAGHCPLKNAPRVGEHCGSA